MALLAGCPGGGPPAPPASNRAAVETPAGGDVKTTVETTVEATFARLEQGRLAPAGIEPGDGWETALPDGTTVTRSTLQAEARPLIDLGADAVPALLPWVQHANAALRYVAIYALGEITGERPQVAYFDDADAGGDRARAIEGWQRWYDAHRE